MGQNVLTLVLVVELVFVVTAFCLAIALTAKEHSWVRNLDNVDPSLAPYITVPDLVNYNVFACIFGVASLLFLVFTHTLFPISVFLMVQVVNFITFLATFIQFETSDLTHANCDALSGTGNLYTSFCSLPKVCEAFSVICWVLFLAAFGVARANVGSDASEKPAMTEVNPASQADDI